MTTFEPQSGYPVYAHPLVSWGAVIFGALAAVAIGVLLNLLVMVFAATANLHQLDHPGEGSNGVLLLGVFGALANLVALFAGGFIAARSANHPDHHDGMLHGVGVWALAFILGLALLSTGAGKTMDALTGGGAPFAGMAQSEAAAAQGEEGDAAAPGAAQIAGPSQVQPQASPGAKADAETEARALATGARDTAFFGFAAMLVGLVAALVGGVAGARHPHHFSVRPRRVIA
jgi:hypothetical protein